jgi:hypothetical protein
MAMLNNCQLGLFLSLPETLTRCSCLYRALVIRWPSSSLIQAWDWLWRSYIYIYIYVCVCVCVCVCVHARTYIFICLFMLYMLLELCSVKWSMTCWLWMVTWYEVFVAYFLLVSNQTVSSRWSSNLDQSCWTSITFTEIMKDECVLWWLAGDNQSTLTEDHPYSVFFVKDFTCCAIGLNLAISSENLVPDWPSFLSPNCHV